ncbi:Glu-tRNA(Gln) amidotransferase subunit GatD [Candidatus Woesearchaeota archaeon]|nr:Glu-tRNA(Gln) amidotransferase subunit GatD [Candidatus Woesearchaeota archaeon]
MAKPGERVKIKTDKEEIEGVLMPEEKEFVVIKLDTGYNMGIDKQRVKAIHTISKKEEKKAEFPKEKQKKDLPTITILHTGGTIASKVDYETGGVIARFEPEEILAMFPELKDIANIKSRLVSNMFSENMRFGHYNILAKEIDKEKKAGVDGVIITHGTDTMHYTSAALSFMLKDLPMPVILAGAQRSSDRGSSDAALNLISAAFFIAANKKFAEVAVCMHENTEDKTCVILPGTKCRKMHSSRRDAFQAINVLPWARVDYDKKQANYLRTGFRKTTAKKKTQIMPMKEDLKVGIIYCCPNMYAEQFKAFSGYAGLVIDGTGLGHAPVSETDKLTKENAKIMKEIQNLIKKGTTVVMTTQTIFGAVDMNVYAPGRQLIDIGVLGNYCDMTPETAYIKLSWLLSNYPKEKAKEMFGQNLVGEISERLEYEKEFIKQ